MKDAIRVVAISGSLRKDSYNTKLLNIATEMLSQEGIGVTVIELREYLFPLYDGDIEAQQGLPVKVRELKQIFREHQGLLIASPEYNSSITAVLKNTIDWISRPEKDEPGLVAFAGKVAALISASPGALGGLRGLTHLRQILGNIQVLVIPEQYAVSQAKEALKDDTLSVNHQEKLRAVVSRLALVLRKLATSAE